MGVVTTVGTITRVIEWKNLAAFALLDTRSTARAEQFHRKRDILTSFAEAMATVPARHP
jgi:hypothetical protein